MALLTDKRAIVTGASRGIGKAIVERFAAEGATILAAARSKPSSLPAGVAWRDCDVAKRADIDALIAQAQRDFGGLDVLVNNAAVNIEKPAAATDDAHWDLHLAVVMKAPFFCTRAALPALRQRRGCVVNVASELGLHAIPNNVAYVSAKHGVLAMTRALAIELAPAGVRVNAICPGTMDTELMKECAADSGDPAAYYRAFNAYHPVGRIAAPEEIAAFLLCMASPAASFLTGAAIPVDGGSTAGRVPL